MLCKSRFDWCIWDDQAFFLEVGPERAGYFSAQPGQVLAHLFRRNWSWDYRHDGRMPEGELQGRRGQRHVVTPADGRDAFHLCDNVRLGGRVAVGCVWPGSPRQYPRGVGCADHDRDAVLGAHLQLIEALLVEERIGHRDKKEIHRKALQEARDHADQIYPDADGLDLTPRLEVDERPVSVAGVQLAHSACDTFLRPMEPRIQVVDQQRLHAIEAEASEAHFVALQDAVTRVVEARLERQPADPCWMLVVVRVGRAGMHPAHLG